MVHGRQFLDYALDLVHGARQYPSGWLKPKVVEGYFSKDASGGYQRLFFEGLLGLDFRRTHWQLVFPGQTAGLVKKIPPTNEGVDEYHVRFYDDGIIDCELEVNRFNGWHWAGKREHSISFLETLLDQKMIHLTQKEKEAIRPLLGFKNYSDRCIRK